MPVNYTLVMDMRPKAMMVILVSVMLLAGLGSMAAAASPSTSTSPVKTSSVSPKSGWNWTGICSSNESKSLASELLTVVQKLSNVTSRLMKKANITNATVRYYSLGERYEKMAFKAYNNGSYCTSIRDSFKAMRYYKLAIMSMRIRIPNKPNVYYEAKGELRMMRVYTIRVERLIGWLSLNGVNVTNITKLYNETLAAYTELQKALSSNNVTAIQKDLKLANEKRAELDMALRNAMKQVVRHKARFIVSRFLNWTKIEIQALKGMENETNVTWIKAWIYTLVNALEYIYNTVYTLAESNNYVAALEVIKSHMGPIRHSVMILGMHHRGHGHRGQHGRGGHKG